jgi:hypothetical protein
VPIGHLGVNVSDLAVRSLSDTFVEIPATEGMYLSSIPRRIAILFRGTISPTLGISRGSRMSGSSR